MKPEVQVVLTSWKRPANVARIVRAFRGQSVPCLIRLVDCHPSAGFVLDTGTLSLVDTLITLRENLGPPSRFLGAFAHPEVPCTYFHDDDALPGPRCLEHYALWHERMKGSAGVLGQVGRIFRPGPEPYVRRNVFAGDVPVAADTAVRFHYLSTHLMIAAFTFARSLCIAGQSPPMHDDLVLNLSIQLMSEKRTMLIPSRQELDVLSCARRLSDEHAFGARPEHLAERNRLITAASAMGWRSMV